MTLTLVPCTPVAPDRDVHAFMADLHYAASRWMRTDACTLLERFPGNDLAAREAESLRADADLLLRSARALADGAGHVMENAAERRMTVEQFAEAATRALQHVLDQQHPDMEVTVLVTQRLPQTAPKETA